MVVFASMLVWMLDCVILDLIIGLLFVFLLSLRIVCNIKLLLHGLFLCYYFVGGLWMKV